MPLIINGWTLLYHPVFGDRYAELRAEVRRLRRALSDETYRQHPLVKLAAGVHHLIGVVVPPDPVAAEFRLRGDLAMFCRAKGHGLPARYRLFWVGSHQAKAIVFLYLNDQTTLRKAGSKSDPYYVFRGLIARGEIGQDFSSNLAAWEREHSD